MLKYDLNVLNEYVKKGKLTCHKHKVYDLYIYDYTKETQHDKLWDEVTVACRGLVVDADGNCISKPYPKFFTHDEHVKMGNIPPYDTEPYRITVKEDGSLGIVSIYKDDYLVNTRGSFYSDQALFADKWLRENDIKLFSGYTYLFEIIYPENKIVLDYNGFSGLILLSIIDTQTGKELEPFYVDQTIENNNGKLIAVKELYYTSLQEMLDARNNLTKHEEGFVITFKSGLKVKMKGDEYYRLSYLSTMSSPLELWRNMDIMTGKVNEEYIRSIDVEFQDVVQRNVYMLEKRYSDYMEALYDKIKTVPEFETTKLRYDWLQEAFPDDYIEMLFIMNSKSHRVKTPLYYNIVKPKANVLLD